ncbi:MAG: acylphosphatase [Proteobacteria bacterium]|nr:acylphosphatase [Pseudomonadota bacterium]
MDSNSNAQARVARLIRVRGLVQGVGFRAACMRHARGLGIVGWVRNRSDGSVEALLLGAPELLDRMCAWLQGGVAGARVTGVEVEPAPLPDPAPSGFEMLPTR